MKIGVISDTHGNKSAVVCAVNALVDANAWIHLGDFTSDAQYLQSLTKKEVYSVSGNCDTMFSAGTEKVITIADKRIFITHGHRYAIDYDRYKLFYRAEELSCVLALYGHSHISMVEASGNVVALNPGSPSRPRGGRAPSIGLVEIVNEDISTSIIVLQ